MFIGVSDDGEVIGIVTEKNDLEKIAREIVESINKLPVYHFCREKRMVGCSYNIMEVYDGDDNLCGFVLALKIEQFCCVAFAKEPDSWHVEDSTVKRFTVEEWIYHTIPGE